MIEWVDGHIRSKKTVSGCRSLGVSLFKRVNVGSLPEGILYEMGGTWVTHHMAFLFKEMLRYKMDRDLLLTHHSGYENDYYTLNVPGMKSVSFFFVVWHETLRIDDKIQAQHPGSFPTKKQER